MEKLKNLLKKIKGLILRKKVLFIIIAAVLVVAIIGTTLIFALPAMFSGSGNEGVEGGASGGNTAYNVSVKTQGDRALADIDVYVYTDSDLEDMLDYKKTKEDGTASFNLDKSEDYAIVLSGVPKGYEVSESYKFDGEKADIVLSSSLITDEDISSATLGLGDVMYDFTVTTSKGEKFTLSEVLKEKKLVVLNFWYTTCSWCLEEFPVMNEVYKDYADDVAIVALDPMDDAKAVEAFANQYGYDFPMASCPTSWSNTFGITGYPTSVFIDRYGVICVVEAGAITSKRPFVSAFEHFTADDYKQTLCQNGIGDLVTQIKPTYTMDTSEAIGALINKGNINVTYRPETEDANAEYIWPFIAGEKLGESCVYASNKGIDDSYAIMYADVTLKKGQALGFDYLISSERLCDVMYVIVDDEDVFQISGVSEKEEWQSCYPCVADKDGTYEVAFCFLKDSDGAEGDDTVYIDNVRVVNESEIDVATYLPRQAAVKDGDSYSYVDLVYNEQDSYYHVGSADGPLLLADLINYTQFNEEETLHDIVYAGDADKDGVSLYDKVEDGGLGMVTYFSYASNSSLSGVCTVTKELAEMLKQVAEVAGFEDDENEWLKICKYYQAYGPDATQLEDPIKGLAGFNAFKTTVGTDVETNSFYYDRPIIPRGLFSEFTPTQSGVYRFTSKSDYEEGIEAWLFDENCQLIYTYAHDERMYDDRNNCSVVYYMEAGKTYYLNMAFWDVYATGTINYDVEYVAPSMNLFRLASPGFFTYDTDATGSAMYDVIDGGITPELKDDGYYYDADDGSLIYADFEGVTNIFGNTLVNMIDMGSFDFSKSESDHEILAYLKNNGGDVDKTVEYLEELWGEDFDAYSEEYQIDDIFEGKYHGDGEDYTEKMRAYVSKIDNSSNTERNGCVPVDEGLVEILELLMNKYTFEDVENSWLKVCYYYDYLGAND
ncbi:MAG: TlpA family protein disulfide reductase [Clostridia bacterium]|nr:TlpA family protein disulfide reductase [Clostridia bacterium]